MVAQLFLVPVDRKLILRALLTAHLEAFMRARSPSPLCSLVDDRLECVRPLLEAELRASPSLDYRPTDKEAFVRRNVGAHARRESAGLLITRRQNGRELRQCHRGFRKSARATSSSVDLSDGSFSNAGQECPVKPLVDLYDGSSINVGQECPVKRGEHVWICALDHISMLVRSAP